MEYTEVNIVCPYFKGEKKRHLLCEGLGEGLSAGISVYFRDIPAKNMYRQLYCERIWQACPMNRLRPPEE
jgi:hypothetical protein